jgi:cytochrome c biogenesis protein CcmG/thiol:disulfide interchange protein DsbE
MHRLRFDYNTAGALQIIKQASNMKRGLFFIPLIIFILLCLFLWRGLGKNPADLPSALINKPFPAFRLPSTLEANIFITQDDLLGKVSLVNVWATWCVSCQVEHPFLLALARDQKIFIVGMNYKDDSKAAVQWLTEKGNPYFFSFNDSNGQLGLNLGVYGAPETYVIDKKGIIRYKYVGVINETVWEQKLKPEFDRWQ